MPMSKGKVLVIDDEYKIRSLLQLYLIKNEYEVITAESGPFGLDLIEKHRPDLIVLDIVMPEMNGLEVCEKIREKYQIPIIYLSCQQESETIITGLEAGGDDYLTKPFDPNVLVARINAILRRSRMKKNQAVEVETLVYDPLTDQEVQILQWIEKGYTNKEIAGILKLKEGTIKVYNSIIFQKLRVKNRTQAIVKAKEAQII